MRMVLRERRFAGSATSLLARAWALLGLLVFGPGIGYAIDLPLGYPIVQVHSANDYNGHSRSSQIAKGPNGLIYLANHRGLFEYDGSKWNVVDPESINAAYSVTVNDQGRIYTGNFSDFGYIERDKIGVPHYVSLREHFPEWAKGEQIFTNIQCQDGLVYANTSNALFLWNEASGRMDVYEGLEYVSEVFVLKGEIYVTGQDIPLKQLVGGSWKRLEIFDEFKGENQRIRKVAVDRNGFAYLVTSWKGIFRYDGERVSLFSDDPLLMRKWHSPMSAEYLDSGLLVVGTNRTGLYIFNSDGEVIRHVRKSDGLDSETVLDILADDQSGIWMVQKQAIVRAQIPSPMTFYDERHGLEGIVHAIAEIDGKLYVGTEYGLYKAVAKEGKVTFRSLCGVEQCRSILVTENGALVGSPYGLFAIRNGQPHLLFPGLDSSYLKRSSKYPNIVLAGGGAYGLGVMKLEGGEWRFDRRVEGYDSPIHGFTESGIGDFWVKSGDGLTCRIEINEDEVTWESYDVSDGLSEGWVSPLAIGGEVVFTTSTGSLLRFDSSQNRFVEDSRYEYFPGEKPHGFQEYVMDPEGALWVSSSVGDGNLIPKPEGEYLFGVQFFSEMPDERALSVLGDRDGTFWFGTTYGMLRYDRGRAPPIEFKNRTFIRRIISMNTGEVLLESAGGLAQKTLRVPANDRSLRIDVSSSSFFDPERTEYLVSLLELDSKLAIFSNDGVKEYSNLSPGTYTLIAQSRDPHGRVGDIETLSLIVEAPYYQTGYAYFFYALLLIFLVYCLLRWRVRQLRTANCQLQNLVEERTSEIARQSEALEEKNDQLANRNEELKDMAKEASEALDAKSRFLAVMSHEIRTPMNGVMGMCALLEKTRLDSEQREFLSTAKSSGGALLSVIDDILDFSKFEEGRLDLEAISYDVVECVESVVMLLGPQAIDKGLDLVLRVDTAMLRWHVGDPTRFRQVVVNLVGNAVKYTRSGYVEVVLGESRRNGCDMVELEVRDSGIGISEKQIEGIFDPFSQADVSTARVYGGSGLGLAICKRIATQMDGFVEVESEVDRGSSFRFGMVATPSPEQESEAAPVDWAIGKRVALFSESPIVRGNVETYLKNWGMRIQEFDMASVFLSRDEKWRAADLIVLDRRLTHFGREEILGALRGHDGQEPVLFLESSVDSSIVESDRCFTLTKPITPTRFRNSLEQAMSCVRKDSVVVEDSQIVLPKGGLKVLVAEDNKTNQLVVMQMLKKLGVIADLAENGEDTVNLCFENEYDIVFMDIQMPLLDGVEAAEKILAKLNGDGAPRIYGLSAGVLPEEKKRCLESGMVGFISKPVEVSDIETALNASIK